MSHKEYEYEGIWTSSDGNYSTLSEHQVKRIISPDLNDLLLKIKVRSRINGDSDRYEEEVFTSEEILNGTKVKILELDSVEYFAIFCFHFSPTSFPFGIEKVYLHVNFYQYHISILIYIEKVYLHVKEKSKVFVVSPGNFYTFERKRNQMSVIPELKYDYQVFCFFTQSNLIYILKNSDFRFITMCLSVCLCQTTIVRHPLLGGRMLAGDSRRIWKYTL